jgi:hypothetical protein
MLIRLEGMDTAWVLEHTRVLTQILREPIAQLPVKVDCDLRVRNGKSVFAQKCLSLCKLCDECVSEIQRR